MYLDDLSTLPQILQKAHFVILLTGVDVQKTLLSFSTAISIPLGEKGTHDIETIRQIELLTRAKYTTPQIILLPHAEMLTLGATNAFLKLLEEPNDNISFVFLAPLGATFLPTVASRAKLFRLRDGAVVEAPDEVTLAQARTLVAGNPRDVIALASVLAKNRPHAVEVVRTAIAQLYQAQLKKPTSHFLARLEKLLVLEKALAQNGHIKLHVVNVIQ